MFVKKSFSDLNRLNVEEFKAKEKIPLVVVLDNVRSQHNVGAVFRTSDAFLVEKIYLCGITATPPNREIHKSALGATESVEWQYFEKTVDAVNHLKNQGFSVFALEQTEGSVSLLDFERADDDECSSHSREGGKRKFDAVNLPAKGTVDSKEIPACAGMTSPIALILGNEVDGVSDDVLPLIDGAFEIPQFGTKHSLNVSVSAGIAIWEIFKKMNV